MTDLLVDMSQHLVSIGICSGIADDIFQNFTPDDPDNIVALTEYAGLPQVSYSNVSVRSVQVKVRSTSGEQARTKAWQIYNAFFNPDDPMLSLVGTSRVVLCKPRQQPTRLTTDTLDRVIWSFNMGVTTQNEI